MMTNPIRLSVIAALDEGLAYSHSDYFAPLLMQGISTVDIGLIELVTTILRSEPYLNETDLLERGVSQKQIQRTLGGFDNFKQLLKVDDYCFSDLLRDNNWDISHGITLSYFQYQKFIKIYAETTFKAILLTCIQTYRCYSMMITQFTPFLSPEAITPPFPLQTPKQRR